MGSIATSIGRSSSYNKNDNSKTTRIYERTKKKLKTKTENCIESCVTNRQRNFSETVKRISHKVYEVNYEKKECLH